MRMFVITALLGLIVAGCGTIKGLAHDISWAGQKVDESIKVPE